MRLTKNESQITLNSQFKKKKKQMCFNLCRNNNNKKNE